jgi:hypothetical protein
MCRSATVNNRRPPGSGGTQGQPVNGAEAVQARQERPITICKPAVQVQPPLAVGEKSFL